MEETTATPGVRLCIGIVAGAVVGVLLAAMLDRREPPVPLSSILIPVSAGAAIGGFLALLAGGRRVSIFWPYLVVVFGLITIMPWWWYEKTASYLPLGAIYVNRARPEVMLRVFVPHLLVSLVLASGLTAAHRWLFSTRRGRPK